MVFSLRFRGRGDDVVSMVVSTRLDRLPLAAAGGRSCGRCSGRCRRKRSSTSTGAAGRCSSKGSARSTRAFFDAADFSRALSQPGPVPDDFLRASFDEKTGAGASALPKAPGEPRSRVFRATVDQATALFDAGATLCLSQVETRVARLAPFVAAIKRQLGYPGKASFNAYLSPPGSGFNWHFDARIASTLQIDGTKRWRFSRRPAIAWPRANGTLHADGTPHYADPGVTPQTWERLEPLDESDVDEVLLEPGDLLILPAGTWHEACGGTGGSLALNLSFTPVSYTTLVRGLLDALLLHDAAWRSAAPVLPDDAPGTVDADGVAAIAAQLRHAAAALSVLSGDSAEVARLWSAYVRNPNPGTPMPPPTPRPFSTAAVRPDERLRVCDDVYVMPADGGAQLCIAAGTSPSVELSGEAAQLVLRMLRERAFTAHDCMGWSTDATPFAWDDVEHILGALVRQRVVEPVSPTTRH